MRVMGLFVKMVVWLAILSIPVLGVWFATSLAVYANGPVWAAIAAGAMLFPVLPIAWEIWASGRRARKKASGSFMDAINDRERQSMRLGVFDRLFLRTLALNGLFVGALLYQFPHTLFTAVTARGDWMLDDVDASWAQDVRDGLLFVADTVQHRFEAEEVNPFTEDLEEDESEPPPTPPPITAPTPTPTPYKATPRPTPPPEPVLTPWVPSLHVVDPYRTERTIASAKAEMSPAAFADDLAVERFAHQRGSVPKDVMLRWWYDGKERKEAFRLQPAVVEPSGIVDAQLVDPFIRITLNEDASRALCEATKNHPGRELFVHAEDRIQSWTRIHEPLCAGVVAIPMDPTKQADDYSTAPEADASGDGDKWPMASEPHPLASGVPTNKQGSIYDVANYIRDHEPNPHLRFKAIHDYIVTRVTYDVESLKPGKRKPQDADTVFRDNTGVCAGYANLLTAMARQAGFEITNISGRTREVDGGLSGGFHAWNAVRIEDKWYLVDSTWNAGSVGSDGFTARYSSDYLFTPPELFRAKHLPEKEGWQLIEPISQGEFVRQPLLRPRFHRLGLELISPQRSQVTARDSLDVVLSNPRGAALLAEVDGGSRCTIDAGSTTTVSCPLATSGTHRVMLFAGKPGARSLSSVGSFEVVVP